MTKNEYLQQNLAGFENDSFAKEKMKQIIADNNINVVIETGTYLGSTTKHFSQWVPKVITIEVNKDNYEKSLKELANYTNVAQFFGSSDTVLEEILPLFRQDNIFFFLDAHWNEYNPLINELAVIASNKIKPIIAIHDFKVPGHPELGFDTYGDIIYEWDWIKSSIEAIYGEKGYRIEYNSEATGAKRGIIYIFPA